MSGGIAHLALSMTEADFYQLEIDRVCERYLIPAFNELRKSGRQAGLKSGGACDYIILNFIADDSTRNIRQIVRELAW